MLFIHNSVSFFVLIALFSTSSAEEIGSAEVVNSPIEMETAFARHAMEISDLLRMFITLIKKADVDEGHELGLPEIATTIQVNLESASLEELFDRFETAAQSFRTRFLKYLKSKKALSSVTPKPPNVIEHSKKVVSKYVQEDEVIKKSSVPEPELGADYSTLAAALGEDYSISATESPVAFVLTNEETADSESASDSDETIDETTLAFVISNMEEVSQETEESPPLVDGNSEDVILTFVPNEKGSFESSRGGYSFETSPAENFEPDVILNHDVKFAINGKSQFMPVSEESFENADAVVFESNNAGAETLFTTGDASAEVTETPFPPTYNPSEEYTLVSFSTTEDGEITETHSTDFENIYGEFEETSEVLSTTDDSDEETSEVLSTTDDSDEDTSDIRPTEDVDSGISKIDEMAELVRIFREAAEKYGIEESKRSKYEVVGPSEGLRGSRSLLENMKNLNTEQILKVTEPSIDYVITRISPANGKPSNEQVFSEISSLERKYGNAADFSNRKGPVQDPIYSHLDVIGMAGENYPNYTNIPETSFTCEGKESPGLYADLETRCQVFHVCWPHRMESYLCPIGSTFHQEILSCDYWFNSTCSLSSDFYETNLRLKNYLDQIEDGLFENNDDVYPYTLPFDFSQSIFKEMKFLPYMYKAIDFPLGGRGIESGREIDYNETVQIKFDETSTLPPLEDLIHEDTTTDMIDSVKDRFRELLRSFVESEISKKTDTFVEDSSLDEIKLEERKYVYEKMSTSKFERTGILPQESKDSLDEGTDTSKSGENDKVLLKSTKVKMAEQMAPAIVFKVLETAENVVTKGILPLTRDMLATNYIKLYKKKKL